MPRQARIDAPGALHHVIVRGIARRRVFNDDADRDFFAERLGRVLSDTETQCFAWSLMPNHFHLLLKTGATPIAWVMKRLLTGYAMHYNRRHRRNGHLFQNRYKSILCQEDAYLLELVRYNIIYKKSVRRDLQKLSKPEAKRIIDLIEKELIKQPESNPVLKGQFAGLRKYRVGDYGVIYALLGLDILILRIGNRKDVYISPS
jgi:addiction module RelE/StbE family toxin